MESAATGWIEWRWYLSREDKFLGLRVRMVWKNRGEQRLGVRMQDIAEQFFSGRVINDLS
jgi:hypothetical protein